MTVRRTIKFNLRGGGVRLEAIGMAELGELLKHLEAAIKVAVPPEERAKHVVDTEPVVSLVLLKEGSSVDMAMAVADFALPGLSDITEAIAKRTPASMPNDSLNCMFSIFKWVAKRRLEFEIEPDEEANIRHAVISRRRPVPSPMSATETVVGLTAAYGYLVRAGGEKPRAALRFPDGRKVTITADEIVTKELGRRLYEEVGIEGVATWRIRDWKMIAFKALHVLEYRPQLSDLNQAFKDLAEASGGRWEGVDAEQYVRELRGETEQ